MKVKLPFYYEVDYIPFRCRKPRTIYLKDTATITIPEIEFSEDKFPLAFIVKDYGWRYETDNGEASWGLWSDEIRFYKNNLYLRSRASDFCCHAVGWATVKDIIGRLTPNEPWGYTNCEKPDKERIILDGKKEKITSLKKRAKNWLIIDNNGIKEVWRKTSEPMYHIITFGLGHNHASTSFSISNTYNPNLSQKAYFTALQREEMIKACVETAIRRGDTNSVDNIKNSPKTIEVYMPELVKRNPNKEHGDGDSFHNMLSGITETASSAAEAAILVLATAIK